MGIKKTCNILHCFYHLTGFQICFFSAQMISIWVGDFRFNFIKDNEHHFETIVIYMSFYLQQYTCVRSCFHCRTLAFRWIIGCLALVYNLP